MVDKIIADNQPFTDADFPPNDNSLFTTQTRPEFCQGLTWKRAS